MVKPVSEQQRHNQAEQQRIYGAPLGELFRDVSGTFSLSQGRLAGVLGVSAPMLSQLASGHRVKIGNPAAVSRLQRLVELGREVRDGVLDPADALARLEADAPEPFLTLTTHTSPRRGAELVRRLFRATATPDEYAAAADRIEHDHPAVATLLRAYGAGPLAAAEEHFERTQSA